MDRGQVGTITVSPDGCKVAWAIINDYGRGPLESRIKYADLLPGQILKIAPTTDHLLEMATSAQGREYSVATGRFRESEVHWPLSGYEFKERIVATRPFAASDHFPKRTLPRFCR